jgi:hypothetical protein
MFERSLSSNEIIQLLSKLKTETQDYPVDLMYARRAAFLKQAFTVKFDGPGRGGKGGGDGGGSGSGGPGVLGGTSAAQGILLQAVIGVWIIAAMLATAYVFRDQIIDILQSNGIVTVELTQEPSIDSPLPLLESPAIQIPSEEVPPTDTTLPSVTATPDASSAGESVPAGSSEIQNAPDTSNTGKEDQGLHLGQTPGAPDTPNQDNPDKPTNPDNPNKPDKKK